MNNHYVIDQARWAKLDIFHQMGNIYSEVGRSIKARNQKKSIENNDALVRAIDLFDATINALIATHSPKAREVLRSKEQFLDIITDSNANKETVRSLDRYFQQFAIAARLNR